MSMGENIYILSYHFGQHHSLNHIDTMVILPRCEGSCMVYRFEWHQEQKYSQIPILYMYQNFEILVMDIRWFKLLTAYNTGLVT